MATSFKREPKMMTTEPSDDEVGHGMKRGGHAHKKHKAMGGPMIAPPMPKRAAMAMRAPMATRPPMPIMRKHGGKAEGGAEHKAEMKEMHKIEKELKHHESMKASKAHHGLKMGGQARAVPGGLLGGVMDKGPTKPAGTKGVREPGYKHGGNVHAISGHAEGSMAHHKAMLKHYEKKCAEGGSMHDRKMMAHHKMCCEGGKMHKAEGGLAAKGDAFQARSAMKPKINPYDKVNEAKQVKSMHTKTTGVEGKGYKRGGAVSDSVAKRYEHTMMHDGAKMPTHKKGTGEIHEAPAGYKHGGHVKHHEHNKHESGGHIHMHKHSAKHAHGHEHHGKHETHHSHGGHHTTKMSTHKKAGGKCNY